VREIHTAVPFTHVAANLELRLQRAMRLMNIIAADFVYGLARGIGLVDVLAPDVVHGLACTRVLADAFPILNSANSNPRTSPSRTKEFSDSEIEPDLAL
jgi:hypothetical protein